jgi:hypothetical protein
VLRIFGGPPALVSAGCHFLLGGKKPLLTLQEVRKIGLRQDAAYWVVRRGMKLE